MGIWFLLFLTEVVHGKTYLWALIKKTIIIKALQV